MTTDEKLIKNKLGLLELASYLQNVSEACRTMGYSRDTFYRVKKAYDEGGVEALKLILELNNSRVRRREFDRK